MRVARTPEQRPARLAEAIEGAHEREVAERLLLQSHTPGEVIERAERSALSLPNDRVRLSRPKFLDRHESEPDVMDAACAMTRDGVRSIDNLIRGVGHAVRHAVRRAVMRGGGVV